MATNQCAPCSNGCDPAQGLGNETDFWQRTVRILCQIALGLDALVANETVGSESFRSLNLSDTGEVVSAVPAQITDYSFFNNTAGVLFVKLYDTAIAPTAADIPIRTLLVPAGSGENLADLDIEFAVGIGVRGVQGIDDANAVSPAVNGLLGNIGFKVTP